MVWTSVHVDRSRAYNSAADHLCPLGGDVRTRRYRITISGGLGEAGRQAFSGFRIELKGRNTVLIGDLDQSGYTVRSTGSRRSVSNWSS